VRERIPDRNVWLVYGAIFVLGVAYGLTLSLLAIFLDGRGISKQDIGSLATWFAGGIVVAAMPVGTLIRRFSARWTLLASLVGYAAAVAVFPLMPSYASLAA
jgi:predicted MFS family arabinose efflux permease